MSPRAVETLLVAAILVAGSAIRLGRLDLSSVEHFDEGVYASNIWFDSESGFRYPMRHMYAPALLPWLIEWSMILSGRTSGLVAILPSLIAGVATPAVVWWCARRWCGPAPAAAAACLAAFSDVHAMLSRAALTDSLLLFFLVAAALHFERACRTARLVDFALAGAITGLAWWTKYNGWLPLAIALFDPVARLIKSVGRRARAWRLVISWCVAATIAALVWSPYLASLQSQGGYAAVAANHRQYLTGLSGWGASLTRQIANLRFVDGTSGSLGWGAAVLAAWIIGLQTRTWGGKVATPPPWIECGAVVIACGIAAAAARWLGASTLCLVLGALGLAGYWLKGQHLARPAAPSSMRHLSAWFLLLLALTPLYTPYMRLMLPLLGAAWLASGQAVGLAIRLSERSWPAPGPCFQLASRQGRVSITLVASLGIVAITELGCGVKWPLVWLDDRRGLERAAAQIDRLVDARRGTSSPRAGQQPNDVIYVYAEPGLLFQLRAVGHPAVIPVDRVDLQPARSAQGPLPTYLVFGWHAHQDAQFKHRFGQLAERFELLAANPYQPSSLVLLDQLDPRAAEFTATSTDVRVYRLR